MSCFESFMRHFLRLVPDVCRLSSKRSCTQKDYTYILDTETDKEETALANVCCEIWGFGSPTLAHICRG